MLRRLLAIALLLAATHLSAAELATIKFVDGTDVRLQDGRFAGDETDLPLVNQTLRGATVAPLFARPRLQLRRERAGDAPDLTLFYSATFADAASMNDALRALASLRVIEFAEPAARPAPPPSFDISPMTPNLSFRQTYRASAPLGMGVNDVQWLPGGRGENVRIADVEVGWIANHEDLDAPSSIDGVSDAAYGDHGAAVLGVLRAAQNDYGMIGIAPLADLVLVSGYADASHNYNLANAVNVAAARLRPGDVLLVEQQLYCYTSVCPAEWDRATSAAIRNAVARKIVVIEPAGNGSFNLDDSRFADRLGSDSGAIVVGAGTSTTHALLTLSNFGSRVDLQGFGENVATLGYGDAFNPLPDPRQRYTLTFSGTSSAAAIVTGAAAALQSIRIAAGAPPLTSTQMRQVLIDSGTPQDGAGHIGPLPNLAAAVAAFNTTPSPHGRSAGGH